MEKLAKSRRGILLLFLGLLVPALCQVTTGQKAAATLVVSLSLEDLCRQADLIVLGTCEEKHSAWDMEGKRIFTYITIASERCLKGTECPSRVEIQQFGGRVGDIIMRGAGTPQFQEAGRVIVFLKKVSSSYYRLVGLSQGKFTVMGQGDNWYIERDLSGLKLIKKRDKGFYVAEPNQPAAVQLDHFIQTIESYLLTP